MEACGESALAEGPLHRRRGGGDGQNLKCELGQLWDILKHEALYCKSSQCLCKTYRVDAAAPVADGVEGADDLADRDASEGASDVDAEAAHVHRLCVAQVRKEASTHGKAPLLDRRLGDRCRGGSGRDLNACAVLHKNMQLFFFGQYPLDDELLRCSPLRVGQQPPVVGVERGRHEVSGIVALVALVHEVIEPLIDLRQQELADAADVFLCVLKQCTSM